MFYKDFIWQEGNALKDSVGDDDVDLDLVGNDPLDEHSIIGISSSRSSVVSAVGYEKKYESFWIQTVRYYGTYPDRASFIQHYLH